MLVVSGLSACSTIIGISDYEIDPSLGVAGKAADGGDDSGGKGAGIEAGAGGDDTGGKGGASGAGGTGATSGTGATGGLAGMGGMGGDPTPAGCQSAGECDDTIDCTTDTCNAKHECVHTPKDTLCDASNCETCQAGIGCVAGDTVITQILLDADFDSADADWTDVLSDGVSVQTVTGAKSGTKVAKFGPGDITADEQYYADLLQWVTIPEGTVSLTLTGYYKLVPGTFMAADDYVVAAFYEDGATKPFTQFHSFEATEGAQKEWYPFTHTAPKADVLMMGGTEYTFDLVAHLWDTTFQFDSLQLNASVCQ